ncbi:hypothetical protein AB4037_30815 [Labrys sp. KB_33_2]|uniref:hypothetical protein n=1 Tax=Labrys sp. KB_33_2 TaxID=3237479 RepID=UPI003F917102
MSKAKKKATDELDAIRAKAEAKAAKQTYAEVAAEIDARDARIRELTEANVKANTEARDLRTQLAGKAKDKADKARAAIKGLRERNAKLAEKAKGKPVAIDLRPFARKPNGWRWRTSIYSSTLVLRIAISHSMAALRLANGLPSPVL